MMIIMQPGATREQIASVIECVHQNKMEAHTNVGMKQTIIGVVGENHNLPIKTFESLPNVQTVQPVSESYELASRKFHPDNSCFSLDGFTIGSQEIPIFAGPCSVESRSQIMEVAQAVKEAGANALRGGAFKPRQSPYSFQGLGEEGLEYLAEARSLTGLPVVAEVMTDSQVPVMLKYVDMLQIGARNMQNYNLLRAVGETRIPVLLKRGMSATIDDLLNASEYILAGGNYRVVLCERGIRTFETATRNTTDINAIPVLKSLTHLPVMLDPSHSTGHTGYVSAVARAAVAAGADGIIVEVHQDPAHAFSDGGQSLLPEDFARLVKQIKAVAEAVDRSLVPAKVPFFPSGAAHG
jgi:3-deoxy-7-phosphoheptulonate synthase